MDERIAAIRERVANAVSLISAQGVKIQILDDGWLFYQVGDIGSYIPPPESASRAAQTILCAAETHFALAAAKEKDVVPEVPISAIRRAKC